MPLLPLIFTLTSILTLALSQSTGKYKKIDFYFIYYLYFWDQVLLCSSGWPRTHSTPTNFNLLSDGMTGIESLHLAQICRFKSKTLQLNVVIPAFQAEAEGHWVPGSLELDGENPTLRKGKSMNALTVLFLLTVNDYQPKQGSYYLASNQTCQEH